MSYPTINNAERFDRWAKEMKRAENMELCPYVKDKHRLYWALGDKCPCVGTMTLDRMINNLMRRLSKYP